MKLTEAQKRAVELLRDGEARGRDAGPWRSYTFQKINRNTIYALEKAGVVEIRQVGIGRYCARLMKEV
jgi:hypothetical protein